MGGRSSSTVHGLRQRGSLTKLPNDITRKRRGHQILLSMHTTSADPPFQGVGTPKLRETGSSNRMRWSGKKERAKKAAR
jgi:hypothetical protein